MSPEALPPGYKFHPTDEELVCFYLEPKINPPRTPMPRIIPELPEFYKHEPWDLQGKSFRPSCDKAEFYLFAPRERKHPKGSKTNRATPEGYWKSTGVDRRVLDRGRAVVGMKKTLVYHLGRAPNGVRTEWMMHEYRLHDSMLPAVHQLLSFALCRVTKKERTIKKEGTCVAAQLPPPEVPMADDDHDGFLWTEQLFSDDDGLWMEQLFSDDAGCSTATPVDLCSAQE